MDERRRAFEQLVAGPTPLGRDRLAAGALLVGSTVDPTLDLRDGERQLADLARSSSAGSAAELAVELFGSGRFSGNLRDYYDPDNSVLSKVLERGVGIPISLSVVFIDVGHRLGFAVDGVGMPGHFLCRADGVYYDVFHGGLGLDEAGCSSLYARLTGGRARLPEGALAVVTPAIILQRMLWNLRSIAEGRNDFALNARVLALLSSFPDAPLQVRLAHAAALAERGQFDTAAATVEAALAVAPASARDRLRAQADRWAARLN